MPSGLWLTFAIIIVDTTRILGFSRPNLLQFLYTQMKSKLSQLPYHSPANDPFTIPLDLDDHAPTTNYNLALKVQMPHPSGQIS